jgi:hypothetical protein
MMASDSTKDTLSFRKKLDSFRKYFSPRSLRLGGFVLMTHPDFTDQKNVISKPCCLHRLRFSV